MSNTLRSALVEIEQQFSSSYLATTPIQYDNEAAIDPAGLPWISFAIEMSEADIITLAGDNELTGFVDVNIYVPKNEGIWENLVDIGDAVRTALSNIHIGDVVFNPSPGLQSAPDEAEFFVSNITTFFSVTERN